MTRNKRFRPRCRVTRGKREQQASVFRALDRVIREGGQASNPIEEQLRVCPEAFKVGELVGKICDSLKYDRESGERVLPTGRTSHASVPLIGNAAPVTSRSSSGFRGASAPDGMSNPQLYWERACYG